MATKLRRGRRRMFGRNHTGLLKGIGWVLFIALFALAGVGVVHWMRSVPTQPAEESAAPSAVSTETTAPAAVSEPEESTPAPADTARRAAYVPLSSLRYAETREAQLEALRAQGYNTVVFDLKDAAGVLYYAFSGPLAQQARAAAEGAMTAEELAGLLKACAAQGLTPVPRLYAFEDKTAPERLKTARILWSGDQATLWLDAKAQNGGKAWLNPYAADAQAYIQELVCELRDAGVTAVLLDGVRFPATTYQAYFGTPEETAETYAQVLTRFVTDTNALLGEDTALLLAADLAAVTGEDTTVYGGNPLTFGADAVCPRISLAALEPAADAPEPVGPEEALTAALQQVDTRLTFVNGEPPAVLPWLAADCADLTGTLSERTDGWILTQD